MTSNTKIRHHQFFVISVLLNFSANLVVLSELYTLAGSGPRSCDNWCAGLVLGLSGRLTHHNSYSYGYSNKYCVISSPLCASCFSHASLVVTCCCCFDLECSAAHSAVTGVLKVPHVMLKHPALFIQSVCVGLRVSVST